MTPKHARPPRASWVYSGWSSIRDAEQVDAALEQTSAELGPVSILVNNAGGVFASPLLETTENGWDALYKANLRHVLLCTQRVARDMVADRRGGSVISLTSIEGVRAAPGYAAYAAAKAGVINYTRTAAFELAPHGIRVNAIAPDITSPRGCCDCRPTGCAPSSARPSRWAGSAMSTRSLRQQYFSPPTWRAISPGRRCTSTGGRRRPAAGITTPRPAGRGSARPEDIKQFVAQPV